MYFEQTFVLHPEQLKTFSISYQLQWQCVPFDEKNIEKVIQKRGVYAISVRHNDTRLPPHDYVLYIGQAGAKRSGTRTVRARIREYFRERDRMKRPHIWEILNKWNGVLFFHFAAIESSGKMIKTIEQKLNDALLPPYSIGDFSANIRQAKRIWSLT